MPQLKKTPLYEKHKQANAKIIDFFGWALPVEYSGIINETKAARASCVLFDASHMGEIRVTGEGALNFLQRFVSNDVSKISQGKLQYNLILNERGTIVDDCMIYRMGRSFFCVVNASNKEKVHVWFRKHKDDTVIIEDETEYTALLSLQGPCSYALMSEFSRDTINHLKYMHFTLMRINGIECMVSRSGYTGEDGFEIYCRSDCAPDIWDAIIAKGGAFSLVLAGLGARDVLRIEVGYPLYGNDIDDTITPFEASLGWALKYSAKDFIGKEVLLKQLASGITQKRVGFIMEERSVPRKGYRIFDEKGDKPIGVVTSGTYSPNLNKFIGMGRIMSEYANEKTSIQIEIRARLYRATVRKYPFVKVKGKC